MESIEEQVERIAKGKGAAATEPEKAKGPGGRPTLYDEERHLDIVEEYAAQGYTDSQLAKRCGVAYSTFRTWFDKPEFLAALEKGRDRMLDNTEVSMYRSAMGHELVDEYVEAYVPKAKEMKDIQRQAAAKGLDLYDYLDAYGMIRVSKISRKEIAPNPTSGIFVLCNRLPDSWKHVNRVELTGANGKDLTVAAMIASASVDDD